MNEAFGMQPTDSQPRLDVAAATPSFDAMAVYMALLKAIQVWDAGNGQQDVPNLSWFSMKPFCGVTDVINNQGYTQTDGEGLWGMAKANGPGIAVIVKELGAGFSFMGYRGAKTKEYREDKKEHYMTDEEWITDPAWAYARKGDFMKIFPNRDGSDCGAIIGDNGKPGEEQECSINAIFMGYDDDGNVMYWSSNNNETDPAKGGYGVKVCRRTDIQRVVFTRITRTRKICRCQKVARKQGAQVAQGTWRQTPWHWKRTEKAVRNRLKASYTQQWVKPHLCLSALHEFLSHLYPHGQGISIRLCHEDWKMTNSRWDHPFARDTAPSHCNY